MRHKTGTKTGKQSKGEKSMKNNRYGFVWPSARNLFAGVLALTISAVGSSALATGNRSVFVSGNSTFSTDCGLDGSNYAIALVGDLEGCLSTFVQDSTCKETEFYDLDLESGREVFVGKFRGKQGRFRTTYTFDAAYAKGFCQSFDATLEVGGGCIHPLRGTGGVFNGARGKLTFIDVIAGVTGDPVTGEFQPGTGGNNFLYYGRIDFE
jgi:hypothetical protein